MQLRPDNAPGILEKEEWNKTLGQTGIIVTRIAIVEKIKKKSC